LSESCCVDGGVAQLIPPLKWPVLCRVGR